MILRNILKRFSVRKAVPEVVEALVNNMVKIPPGSFLMGSHEGEDDERPIHNVLLDGFLLGKTPVVQGEWEAVMGTCPWADVRFVKNDPRCPAVNINWYQAREFIERLNLSGPYLFRLPTEAEWEYACRAGGAFTFAYGVLKFNLPKYAWYYENAFNRGEMYAHPVSQKRPNAWGVYDMQGNVCEWCSDWYRRNYYHNSPIDNPPGPDYGEYKVIRGGSWAMTDYFLRIASRRRHSPHHSDAFTGFRLAMQEKKSAAPKETANAG